MPTMQRIACASFLLVGLAYVAADGFDSTEDSTNPTATSVAIGTTHACVIQSSNEAVIGGKLLCWGSQCYQGACDPPHNTFVQIVVGRTFSCGITETDSLLCWGDATVAGRAPKDGQLVQIAAGKRSVCVLTQSGKVSCGGKGSVVNQLSSAELHGEQVLQLASTMEAACALLSNGHVRCWGQSLHGVHHPPADSTFSGIVGSSAGDTMCGITRSTADLVCWGAAAASRQQPKSASSKHTIATLNIEGPFVSATVGYDHACGIRGSGALLCSGNHPRIAGRIEEISSNILRNQTEIAADGSIAALGSPQGDAGTVGGAANDEDEDEKFSEEEESYLSGMGLGLPDDGAGAISSSDGGVEEDVTDRKKPSPGLLLAREHMVEQYRKEIEDRRLRRLALMEPTPPPPMLFGWLEASMNEHVICGVKDSEPYEVQCWCYAGSGEDCSLASEMPRGLAAAT